MESRRATIMQSAQRVVNDSTKLGSPTAAPQNTRSNR